MAKKISLFLYLLIFLGPFFAQAAALNILCDSGTFGTTACGESSNPGGVVTRFYNIGLALSGVLALTIIVFAGIEYTLSAGKPALQSDARDRIWQALFGLLLIVGAAFIFNTINPAILNTPTTLGVPTLPPSR